MTEKTKLKSKQAVKAKKQKESVCEKKKNANKNWIPLVVERLGKSQTDWIFSRILHSVCMKIVYLVFIIFVLRLFTFKKQTLWTPQCCIIIKIISKSFSTGFFVLDFFASICSISC